MSRWTLLCCAAFLGCAAPRAAIDPCEPWADDPSASHPRATQYQRTLDEGIEGRLPGAIALISDADGLWMGASGAVDLAHDVPMQTCHRMPIGSLTKTLSAALVLRLVDEGLLSVDAPIAELLPPDVAADVAHSERITVRMLLNHTSGIASYSDQQWYLDGINEPGRSPTQREALESVRGRSDFPPGTQHDYSATNYIVVGLVVEQVTGGPFEDALARYLLDPLEMRATRYRPDAPYEDIAAGYLDFYGDGRFIESDEGNFLANTPRSPSAGVSTDVRDLHRLMRALFRPDELLSASSLETMRTSAADSSEQKHHALGYGLGLVHYDFEQGEAWGHSGSLLGFEAYAHHFPADDVTMILLVNASSLSDAVDDQSVHAYVHREVLPALRRAAPLAPR